MCNYIIVPVSIYFLGKIGSTELAAGGLAICIFHVAGLSIMAGLLTASDTLFSQVSSLPLTLQLHVWKLSLHVFIL